MIDVRKPRTIGQLHTEMLANDPECALTLSALRRLVRSGAIHSCRIGTKYLITYEAVSEFLAGSNNAKATRGEGINCGTYATISKDS